MSMQQAARHAQNLGFEQSEAAAFFMQGGDAIRSYRQEVEDLGLSLSEVDAAKVEAANDAFSRMGMFVEGLQQQLAVESAPYLLAISKQVSEAVKDMGGLGQVAENVFDFIIRGSGFVADAFRGWQVILKGAEVAYKGFGVVGATVAEDIATGLEKVINGAREAINVLIRAANQLPYVNINELVTGEMEFAASIRGTSQSMKDSFNDAVTELHNLLMEPLPSDSLNRWAEGVKQQAEEVAQALVEAQQGGTDLGGGGGMTEEEQKQQEALHKRLEDRLQSIREANMEEVELLNVRFAAENEAIDQAYEERLINEQEWEQLMRDQKSRHEEELTEIEKRAADARTKIAEQEGRAKMQALGSALKNVSTLMNSESRKMFEIGKAAALAGALVDAYAAITGAYKVGASMGGPALGAAYGAAAGLAAFQNVNAIKSAQFGSGGSVAGAAATGSVTGGINQQGQAVTGSVSQSQTLTVQGIDPSQMFSGRQLVDIINTAQKDGAILQVAD